MFRRQMHAAGAGAAAQLGDVVARGGMDRQPRLLAMLSQLKNMA